MAKTTTKTTTTSTRSGRKNKYNVQNQPFGGALGTLITYGNHGNDLDDCFHQTRFTIVPKTDSEGVRKAGKFTINCSLLGNGVDGLLYWALLYVPKGYDPRNFFNDEVAEPSLYQPASNVLASGMNDTNAGPIRIYSPLFKNLNSGDSIVFQVAAKHGGQINAETEIAGLVRYVICYN